MKAGLDRLKAAKAMDCKTENDEQGTILDTIAGSLSDGFYFDCAVDGMWFVNPFLSTGQYYQTAIAMADLAYSATKHGRPRTMHLGPSRDWHGENTWVAPRGGLCSNY